jgi:hypothetical protein
MNICLIPAFQRPEYLQECLTNICKADNYQNISFVFCLDYGFSSQNLYIIKQSGIEHYFIIKTDKTNFKLSKQSYNVLNGLIKVSEQKEVDLIYYIEDDIFISRDFFTFAEDIFKQQPDVFTWCGTRSDNLPVQTTDNKNAYYLTDKADFQTHGNCYNSKLFNKYMKEHFTGNYFNNPIVYCKQFLPSKVVGEPFVEQDGLIRRVIEKNNLLIAYGHVPRCQHSGIYGYNRQAEIMHKSFNEKLKFIQEVCYDAEKMKQYDRYNDSQPCNMNMSHDEVELIPINN